MKKSYWDGTLVVMSVPVWKQKEKMNKNIILRHINEIKCRVLTKSLVWHATLWLSSNHMQMYVQ